MKPSLGPANAVYNCTNIDFTLIMTLQRHVRPMQFPTHYKIVLEKKILSHYIVECNNVYLAIHGLKCQIKI